MKWPAIANVLHGLLLQLIAAKQLHQERCQGWKGVTAYIGMNFNKLVAALAILEGAVNSTD
ncbi:hypothetical protein [Rhizobium sp. GR12]|uniref:hypothetical protein n=1 Tax=Rhizobium TaxID=379 RepID=UPI002FBDD279